MKKDKKKILLFEILLIIILILALLLSNIFSREVLSIILVIYTLTIIYFIKRRQEKSIYDKQVMILMTIFSLIYVVIFYFMGLYFGYYKYPISFSLWSILHYIIPISIIILSSEKIRNVFLSQNIKHTKILTTIAMVLIDLILYINIYNILTLNGVVTLIGFVLFSSIANNMLYNYISTRFGKRSVIVFRLITVLYVYIIPISPDVHLFFRTFLKMLSSYFIFLILENYFSQNDFSMSIKDKKKNVINTSILIAVSAVFVLLISCKFTYGMIVVGSGSMSGTLNIGDTIIYKQYKNQKLGVNDIIIFYRNDIRIIHRIINIRKVNDEIRYYTKGDINTELDDGYVLEKNIVGISMFKIPYIGYPSIWLRDIYNN